MTDPVTVGIFTLSGAAIGALGQALAQWVGQNKQKERERVADLREAQSDFAASAYNLVEWVRACIVSGGTRENYQPKDRLPLQKTLIHEYMRMGILEPDKSERQEAKQMFNRLASLQTTASPQDDEITHALASLLDWVDEQAQRDDL